MGNNSFYLTAKILVTTGYDSNGDYITSSEVIDLLNPNVTCQDWPDYPIGVRGAIGGFLDESVLACGGYSNDGVTDRCFKLDQSKVSEIPGLKVGSRLSAGGIINHKMIITGGYGKHTFEYKVKKSKLKSKHSVLW